MSAPADIRCSCGDGDCPVHHLAELVGADTSFAAGEAHDWAARLQDVIRSDRE